MGKIKQKVLSCLLALSMAAAQFTFVSTNVFAADGNLALGKPVTASLEAEGHKGSAAKAVDGDPNTRWYDGDQKEGNWLTVDLGKKYAVTQVVVDQHDNLVRADNYTIQVSDSGEDGTFTDVKKIIGAQPIDSTRVRADGRYVRIFLDKAGTWGTSIWELEVYGKDWPRPVDRPALQDIYNDYSVMDQGNYTNVSWEVLQDALKAGKLVLDNAQATADEIADAISVLEFAIDDLVQKAPGEPEIIVLEAEKGTLTNGDTAAGGYKPVVIGNDVNASNGKYIENMYDSGTGAGVEFPSCKVRIDGEYWASFRYAKGNNKEETVPDHMTMYVNDVAKGVINLPVTDKEDPTNFKKFGEAKFKLPCALKSTDKISFKINNDDPKGKWGLFWLDKITLTEFTGDVATEGIFEAENGRLYGGAKANNLPVASSGKYVDGFNNDLVAVDGAGVEFTNYEVTKNGAYDFSLGYARYYYEKADKVSVFVNGVNKGRITLAAKGSNVDDTIVSKPLVLTLEKGDIISVQVDASAGDKGYFRLDYMSIAENTVADPEEKAAMSLKYSGIMVVNGATAQVMLKNVLPGDVLTYTTANQDIISLNANTGVFTANAVGEATVEVSSTLDPLNKQVCDITVVATEAELVLEKQSIEAEDTKLVNGAGGGRGTFVRDDAKASAGKSVDNFYESGDGAGIKVVPDIKKAGVYDFSITYARNDYLYPIDKVSIYVNNDYKGQLTLAPRTGFSDYGDSPSIPLQLKPGDIVATRVDAKKGAYGMYRIDKVAFVRNVGVPMTSIALDETATVLNGEAKHLTATTSPKLANTPIIWTSSDESVLTVAGGKIKGRGVGTATVTAASAMNPEIKDTVVVTVAENKNLDTLVSDEMTVTIDKTFPRVLSYKLASGTIMEGNDTALTKLLINGKEYTPTVVSDKIGNDKMKYVLTVAEMDAVITIEVKVEANLLKMDFTSIKESGKDDQRIFTIGIPNHKLVSVYSTDEKAALTLSTVASDIGTTGDIYVDLTKNPAATSVGAFPYGFISNSKVAAGVRSNAFDNRVSRQTAVDGDAFRTSLWGNTWTWRGNDYNRAVPVIDLQGNTVDPTYKASFTEDLPLVYVAIAEDTNKSGDVNWQDAAVEYRKIMARAIGMDEIPDSVVQRLVFPQSGEGNYPFISSLDETKRVYLQTDGLGQLILNKYHNEGIWGDFTAYDDRLGGLRDFSKYVSDSKNLYNSWSGVHTNFTEIYAKASDFKAERILYRVDELGRTVPHNGGYQAYGHWLQQVYVPDVDYDAITLERQQRLMGFKKDVPDLGFIYSDVFSGGGWKGRRLAEDYEAAGLGYFVEWPYQNEEEAVWAHWAVEKSYSPPSLKAYASDVARFIFNDTKDRWDNNSNQEEGVRYPNSCNLLMGADASTYEGWPNGATNNSFNAAMAVVFNNNLPTKFMQQNPILRMEKDENGWGKHIWFENGVEVYQDENNLNKRVIAKDGKVVYTEDAYLIPWDEGILNNPANEEKEVKLYHWSESGNDTTWDIPTSWNGLNNVYLYQLTDLGKTNKVIVPVVGGKVTLTGIKAKTPYVVYKGEAGPTPDVNYGDGTFVKDPGFNYGTLKAWNLDKGAAESRKNDTVTDHPEITKWAGWGRNFPFGEQRNYELIMDTAEESQVSQTITGLTIGEEYAISSMVEIEQGKRRKATLSIECGGKTSSVYADKSILLDFDEYDSKIGTYMTRMRTTFTATETTATIRLNVAAGDGKVRFDNVRVYDTTMPKAPSTAKNVILYQDFEYAVRPGIETNDKYKATYEGNYPFNIGAANGIHETRTSIQKKNDPYTQNGSTETPWDPNVVLVDDVVDGNYSYKILGTGIGMAAQTTPQTVRFEKGKTYRVSIDYELQPYADYALAIGDGQHNPTTWAERTNPTNIVASSQFTATSYPKTNSIEFTATSDDFWFGIHRTQQTVSTGENPTPIVVDNILVEEIKGEVPPADLDTADLEALITYAKAQKELPEYKFVVPVVKSALDARIIAAETAIKSATEQAQINLAYSSLLDVVQMLNYTGDNTTLLEKYNTWKDFNPATYTPESAKAMTDALAIVKSVIENPNALQDEIDTALTKLEATISGMVPYTANKDALRAQIEKANKYNDNLANYIDNTGKTEFVEALAAAKVVEAKDYPTQDEINAACTRLMQATWGLREIPNKDKLQDLINTAKAFRTDGYTKASIATRAAAITRAEAVMADPMATQADVNKAISDIETTTANLVLVEDVKAEDKEKTDKTDTTVPTTSDNTPLAVAFAVAMVGCACIIVRKKTSK